MKKQLTPIQLLEKHGAKIEGGKITISCTNMADFMYEYAHEAIIADLNDILERHSAKANFPAIIKERINNYQSK